MCGRWGIREEARRVMALGKTIQVSGGPGAEGIEPVARIKLNCEPGGIGLPLWSSTQ